jgi:hypothetical protein
MCIHFASRGFDLPFSAKKIPIFTHIKHESQMAFTIHVRNFQPASTSTLAHEIHRHSLHSPQFGSSGLMHLFHQVAGLAAVLMCETMEVKRSVQLIFHAITEHVAPQSHDITRGKHCGPESCKKAAKMVMTPCATGFGGSRPRIKARCEAVGTRTKSGKLRFSVRAQACSGRIDTPFQKAEYDGCCLSVSRLFSACRTS